MSKPPYQRAVDAALSFIRLEELPMTKVLHILDHSLPLHSGYTFRTLSILKEQRALGWNTFHLTGSKQENCRVLEEDVDGWHFYRTHAASAVQGAAR